MRILIVEDDARLAQTLSDILSEAGYLPEIATDGWEAEFRRATDIYAAVVLDLGLPGMAGIRIALSRHAGTGWVDRTGRCNAAGADPRGSAARDVGPRDPARDRSAGPDRGRDRCSAPPVAHFADDPRRGADRRGGAPALYRPRGPAAYPRRADLDPARRGRDAGSERAARDQVVEAINALLRARHDALRRTRDYIGNLAHAMKTPLASLAADQDATLDQQALVTRMNRLVEYHLRRARRAGRADGLGQRVVVRGVMEDIAMVLRPRARDAGISLKIEADAAAVFIGDRGDLADNAITATAARVRLVARQGPETLVLWIEDDGPGLANTEITRALERGVRLDERGPGGGLGLGIVADLVKLNGGELHFARAALGGLRVEVTLLVGLDQPNGSHRTS